MRIGDCPADPAAEPGRRGGRDPAGHVGPAGRGRTEAGRSYQVSSLFKALLLISANDAAVALAQAAGPLRRGIALMNAEAHWLQAYDVAARDPNGLPAGHQHVSACDEALIARRALGPG